MQDIEYTNEEPKVLNVLFVEENDKFRLGVSDLLEEFFKNIYSADNTEECMKLYHRHNPEVIIIDIDMVNIDWIKISKRIKEINPQTKLIILSLHDNPSFLLDAIDIGVTKFLIKPVEDYQLSDTLELVTNEINYENNQKILYTYLHTIFNYEKSMIMMTKNDKPVLANKAFLDFFNVESFHGFIKKHKEIGTLLLKHDGYLYNENNRHWLNKVDKSLEKPYHVQFKNKKEEIKHFLFRYHIIPEEKDYAILSFDDISELDTVKKFDDKIAQSELIKEDEKSIFKLLKLIQKNQIKVHLYNYYKGLTIVHDALIIDTKGDSVLLKTNYLQQKAINIEGKTLISSDVLPYTIACSKVSKISYEKQIVVLKGLHFSRTSPATRKTIRLLPDSKYSVSLFIKNQKVRAETTI